MTQRGEGKTCRHVLEEEMDFAMFHYTTQDMLPALKISAFAEAILDSLYASSLSPLAVDSRAHRVQDRSAGVQSHEWYGTAISGTICPCRRPAGPTGFALCSHQSSDSTSC